MPWGCHPAGFPARSPPAEVMSRPQRALLTSQGALLGPPVGAWPVITFTAQRPWGQQPGHKLRLEGPAKGLSPGDLPALVSLDDVHLLPWISTGLEPIKHPPAGKHKHCLEPPELVRAIFTPSLNPKWNAVQSFLLLKPPPGLVSRETYPAHQGKAGARKKDQRVKTRTQS